MDNLATEAIVIGVILIIGLFYLGCRYKTGSTFKKFAFRSLESPLYSFESGETLEETIEKIEYIVKENAVLKKQLNEKFFTYIEGKGSFKDSKELLAIFDSMNKKDKELFMNDLKKYIRKGRGI